MSTITLENVRACSDITMKVRLKDNGVAVDWSGLTDIKALVYSDDQKAVAGRCAVSVDSEDPTVLVCLYAATKPQYLGVNSIVVRAKYMGREKTYDKQAVNIVARTAELEGEQVVLEDPEVTVDIEVTEVDSSILDNAIAAAFDAADRAAAAAAAAEQMVDIHTGPAGKSAYEVAVDEGYTGTEEQWLASLKGETGDTPDIRIGTVTTVEPGEPAAASMSGTPEAPVLNLSIPKGLVGDTPNFAVGTVTTGEPGTPVVVTITGTAEAPVLNITIPQGMKGDTGVSADYPITIYNGLDSDATDAALSAAQGKVLDGKIGQLEAKVEENEQEAEILENSAWSSSDGSYVSITGRDASAKFPYCYPINIQTDGNIIDHLFWNGDLFLGHSATNANAYTNATKIALNFYGANPTYIRYSFDGIGKDFTDLKQELVGIQSSFVASGSVVLLSKILPAGTVIKEINGGAWGSVSLYEKRLASGVAITPQQLPYTTTKEYDRASASVVGSPELTIITYGAIDSINKELDEFQDEFAPTPTSLDIPSKCTAELNLNRIKDIEPTAVANVSTSSELRSAIVSGGLIYLNNDIMAYRVDTTQDVHIFGNGHKLVGYSYTYTSPVENNSITHNAYPVTGAKGITSYRPTQTFIDSDFNLHEYSYSRWYDATAQITNADGTAISDNGYGQFRLALPQNFDLSADELAGTYIQFFCWFVCLIAKVDIVSDGYVYFTTSSTITVRNYNPNSDYIYYNKYTSFRFVNMKSNDSIYFDDDYLYVPKHIGSVWMVDWLIRQSGSNKCIVEDAKIYGRIAVGSATCSYKFANCEISKTNASLVSGDANYIELSDCYIHDTYSQVLLEGDSGTTIVENNRFKNTNLNNSNISNLQITAGQGVIRHNVFEDCPYPIRVGSDSSTIVPPSSVVEYNCILFSPEFLQNSKYRIPMDAGVIYIASFNNKDSVGAIIRNNIIKNFAGRGDNYGIFCDDGAGYFYIFGNAISNIPNGHCITARYATGRTAPSGYKLNNGKYIVYNVVDGTIRCEVGALSVDDISIVKNNVRLYGTKWDANDDIESLDQSALYSFEETTKDLAGYFDADGIPHSNALSGYDIIIKS